MTIKCWPYMLKVRMIPWLKSKADQAEREGNSKKAEEYRALHYMVKYRLPECGQPKVEMIEGGYFPAGIDAKDEGSLPEYPYSADDIQHDIGLFYSTHLYGDRVPGNILRDMVSAESGEGAGEIVNIGKVEFFPDLDKKIAEMEKKGMTRETAVEQLRLKEKKTFENPAAPDILFAKQDAAHLETDKPKKIWKQLESAEASNFKQTLVPMTRENKAQIKAEMAQKRLERQKKGQEI